MANNFSVESIQAMKLKQFNLFVGANQFVKSLSFIYKLFKQGKLLDCFKEQSASDKLS